MAAGLFMLIFWLGFRQSDIRRDTGYKEIPTLAGYRPPIFLNAK